MEKNSDPFITLETPWINNENVIWLGSTLRLHRNLEKFKFPSKLEAERKKHILSLLAKAFDSLPGWKKPTTHKSEELSPHQKEFLIEHFLLSEGLPEAHSGTGFGVDETGSLIALYNIKDHLQIQITDIAGDLEKTYASLVQTENHFTQSMAFAFLPQFGYLTSNPLLCGTSLIVSAFLHLPALIHTNSLLDALEKEKSEGIIVTGLQGNPDELVGDILMIRNLYTLGINEETILSTIRNAVLHLVVAEKDARSKIKAEKSPAIVDAISRAIGLLKYSFHIDTHEALQALSLVKLGLELGWITGIKANDMNKLFFDARRSHLGYRTKKIEGKEEIAQQRAEFLRHAIEPINLVL